eukprot:TRINITY_DN23460_c0_g1_i1.p1 TRINITY_DN23460_c0_g1~~TRINITY_DN23460_c0_g1_i1.p1  ORF type:complete len:122 (-),score=24.86 TRINITY_DN23460_c0_g1_i1:33-398(-)
MGCILLHFFFQAEDGIRDLVRSRGLGDVYKRQGINAEYGNHSPCANIAREWMDVIQWKPSMDRVFAQAEAQQNEIAAQSIHMIHRNCIELHTLTKVATEYSIAVLADAAGLKAPLPLPIEA